MRIETETLPQFLSNVDLKDEEIEGLYRNTIHYSITHRQDDQREHIVYVVFQASTILCYKDKDQILLQLGINCGRDNRTGNGHSEGSDVATKLENKLKEWAKAHSVKLKPGLMNF